MADETYYYPLQLMQDASSIQVQFLKHDHDGSNSQRIKQTSFVNGVLPGTSAATATNYGVFFIATRACSVKAISEVHTTAGTDVGSVTLQIERLQGTEAPDSGDSLLSTTFNLKGTANIVQEGSLITSNVTILSLNIGDRLCLKDSGTLTNVAGVCVTVELQFK